MSVAQKDIKLLWGRAGNRCAICKKELSQGTPNPHRSYLVGEQAHIVGENPDAARSKSVLPLEQRNSYHNLILLCPNDHTEIDKNEVDWSIERLFTIKSEHELWVQERLGETDRRNEASDLAIAKAIDVIVTGFDLENWNSWASFAASTDPRWKVDFDRNIYECAAKVVATVWPSEFGELRAACTHFAISTDKAWAAFAPNLDRHENWYIAYKFYKADGFNPNYNKDVERYEKWQSRCMDSMLEATKAANWFADVVRRDVNPMFFVATGRFTCGELHTGTPPVPPEYTEAEKQNIILQIEMGGLGKKRERGRRKF